MNALDWYVLVLALVTTSCAWASVVVHAETRWNTSPVGRHLMAYMLALAVTFTALTLGILVDHKPWWFEGVRAAMYTGTPIVVVWRLVLQLQARRHPLTPRPSKGRHR